MDRCYQGLACLVAETQAMYETKGVLEAQPYGSPAVDIVGLPTQYKPIIPHPPIPEEPKLPIGLPWPKPEKDWPELPIILPGKGMPFPPPMMPDLPDGIEIKLPGGAPAYPVYMR